MAWNVWEVLLWHVGFAWSSFILKDINNFEVQDNARLSRRDGVALDIKPVADSGVDVGKVVIFTKKKFFMENKDGTLGFTHLDLERMNPQSKSVKIIEGESFYFELHILDEDHVQVIQDGECLLSNGVGARLKFGNCSENNARFRKVDISGQNYKKGAKEYDADDYSSPIMPYKRNHARPAPDDNSDELSDDDDGFDDDPGPRGAPSKKPSNSKQSKQSSGNKSSARDSETKQQLAQAIALAPAIPITAQSALTQLMAQQIMAQALAQQAAGQLPTQLPIQPPVQPGLAQPLVQPIPPQTSQAQQQPAPQGVPAAGNPPQPTSQPPPPEVLRAFTIITDYMAKTNPAVAQAVQPNAVTATIPKSTNPLALTPTGMAASALSNQMAGSSAASNPLDLQTAAQNTALNNLAQQVSDLESQIPGDSSDIVDEIVKAKTKAKSRAKNKIKKWFGSIRNVKKKAKAKARATRKKWTDDDSSTQKIDEVVDRIVKS